ncbi:hypothetical protein MBLNU459_g3284t2 [Dothideomycetes sp. NU459]
MEKVIFGLYLDEESSDIILTCKELNDLSVGVSTSKDRKAKIDLGRYADPETIHRVVLWMYHHPYTENDIENARDMPPIVPTPVAPRRTVLMDLDKSRALAPPFQTPIPSPMVSNTPPQAATAPWYASALPLQLIKTDIQPETVDNDKDYPALRKHLQNLYLTEFHDHSVKAIWANVRVYEAAKSLRTPELRAFALGRVNDMLNIAADSGEFIDLARLIFAHATSQEDGPCASLAAVCARRIISFTRDLPAFQALLRREALLGCMIIDEIVKNQPQLLPDTISEGRSPSFRSPQEATQAGNDKGSEIELLRSQLEVTKKCLIEARATNAAMLVAEGDDITHAMAELSAANRKLNDIKSELTEAQTNALASAAAIQEKDREIAEATIALEEVRKDLVAKNAHIADLEKDLTQSKSEHVRILSEREQASSKTLSEKNARILCHLQDCESDLKEFQEVNAELQKDNVQLVSDIAELSRYNAKLLETLSTRETQVENVRPGNLRLMSPIIKGAQAPSSPITTFELDALAQSSPVQLDDTGTSEAPVSSPGTMKSYLKQNRTGDGPLTFMEKLVMDKQVVDRRFVAGVIDEQQAREESVSLLTGLLSDNGNSSFGPAVSSGVQALPHKSAPTAPKSPQQAVPVTPKQASQQAAQKVARFPSPAKQQVFHATPATVLQTLGPQLVFRSAAQPNGNSKASDQTLAEPAARKLHQELKLLKSKNKFLQGQLDRARMGDTGHSGGARHNQLGRGKTSLFPPPGQNATLYGQALAAPAISPDMESARRKYNAILKECTLDYKSCNNCAFPFHFEFRGAPEDPRLKFVALRCRNCCGENMRWEV